MKRRRAGNLTITLVSVLATLACSAGALAETPLGSEFSYQGKLNLGGSPVNDTADFEFTLWDADSGGNMIGLAVDVSNVTVVDGLFTVQLDFGVMAFNGEARWLEISVASPSGGPFFTLSPRQPLTAAPTALALRGLRTRETGNDVNLPNSWNIIGGHPDNSINPNVGGGTLAGGGTGGDPNSVNASLGTVSGGAGNTASGTLSTVAGGYSNTASGIAATIGGGENNTAGGATFAVVAGGFGNTASDSAAVGGGQLNVASGEYSAVPGGYLNTATGEASFAAGDSALAQHDHTFVWADGPDGMSVFGSTGPEQFLIKAGGGVGINKNDPATALDVTGTVTADAFVGDGSGLSNVPGIWSEGASNIYYINGNVGIGTDAPATPLAIMGNGGTNPVGITQNAVGGASTMELTTADGEGNQATRILLRGGSDTADIEFYVGAQGAESEAMTIEGATGNVGIGTESPTNALSVNGDANVSGGLHVGPTTNNSVAFSVSRDTAPADGNDAGINDYTAIFINQFTPSFGSDGIVIQLTGDSAVPDDSNNFVQFAYDGSSGGIGCGRIEGNSSGGVTYKTGGADLAEELPRLDPVEFLEAGDVVGVFAGKITRRTQAADRVMVVSAAPGFLGNSTENTEISLASEQVAFMGQVPVKVRGVVAAGDYLVASGQEDGTAVAKSQVDLKQGQLIVGQAWEGSQDPGVKLINTVVGLPEANATTAALTRTVQDLSDQVASLRQQVRSPRSASAQGVAPASIQTMNHKLAQKDAEVAKLQESNAELAQRLSRLEALLAHPSTSALCSTTVRTHAEPE